MLSLFSNIQYLTSLAAFRFKVLCWTINNRNSWDVILFNVTVTYLNTIQQVIAFKTLWKNTPQSFVRLDFTTLQSYHTATLLTTMYKYVSNCMCICGHCCPWTQNMESCVPFWSWMQVWRAMPAKACPELVGKDLSLFPISWEDTSKRLWIQDPLNLH